MIYRFNFNFGDDTMRFDEAIKKVITEDAIIQRGEKRIKRNRYTSSEDSRFNVESSSFQQSLKFGTGFGDWDDTEASFSVEDIDSSDWKVISKGAEEGLSFGDALKEIFEKGGEMQSASAEWPDMKYFFKKDGATISCRHLVQYRALKNDAVQAQIDISMLKATDWVILKPDERLKDKSCICGQCD